MHHSSKYLIVLLFTLLSCKAAEPAPEPPVQAPSLPTYRPTVALSTNQAVYAPGQAVVFTADNLPAGAHIRYRRGSQTVADEPLTARQWTWQPPSTDFQGYLAEVYLPATSGQETILATMAVDVSSHWKRYPRYGFVSDFGPEKTSDVIAQEMQFPARCHINGIQFYDWHNKHHWPLGGTAAGLMDTYRDIANRTVSNATVKAYIQAQHQLGMKAMFYNLCFGTLDDAAADGVSPQWAIFKDPGHEQQDKLDLPAGWKSSIYLVNPGNANWQRYLIDRNNEVYRAFDFDGYHIDQVGSRGTVYDYWGADVNLARGYASFIKAMKEARPDKSLVMNAVSSFGAKEIAETKATDFLYHELWDSEASFNDLRNIIQTNKSYAPESATLFAAYMNYDRRGSSFNTPGVLLTDAVMFALGGAHLELGPHMLCHEYFPNHDLAMSDELRSALIHYYDFLVGYENELRSDVSEAAFGVASATPGVAINRWPPQTGSVTAYTTERTGQKIVHLLNFRQANSLSWRDKDGTMPAPQKLDSIKVNIDAANAQRVWVATPDELGGAAIELPFTHEGRGIAVVVPHLTYWTMLVVETKS